MYAVPDLVLVGLAQIWASSSLFSHPVHHPVVRTSAEEEDPLSPFVWGQTAATVTKVIAVVMSVPGEYAISHLAREMKSSLKFSPILSKM